MSFKIGSKKRLYKGQFTELWSTDFLDKEGKQRTWEYLQKRSCVIVFAVTDENKVVLIKNYRVPIEKYVIETPAGLTDHEDETLEDLAKRELMEETGYVAEKFYALPPHPQEIGVSSAMIFNFLATGAKRINNNSGDATEDITVFELPLAELDDYYLKMPSDTLFSFNILASYEIARHLKILK